MIINENNKIAFRCIINKLLHYQYERKCSLVDPSAEAKVIIGKLKDIGLPVDAILLTHTHYDHFGALDEVQAYRCRSVYVRYRKGLADRHLKNGSIRFTEEITFL